MSGDVDSTPRPNQVNELPRDYDLEGAFFQNEQFRPTQPGLVHKSRAGTIAPNLVQGIRACPACGSLNFSLDGSPLFYFTP